MSIELPPEKSPARRRTEEAIEIAASVVPFAGGVLSLKYAHAFRRSDERRAAVWQAQVTELLNALEVDVQGLSVESLFEDDQFVDALATATRIAEKSAADAKRRALQNALFNIGSGHAPDADKCTVYLRYVDELTPSHMTLLDFFGDPPGYLERRAIPWPNLMMGGLGNVVKAGLPALAADQSFLNTLVGDLDRWGLISNPGLNSTMTGEGLKAGRSTEKGREFLEFVTGPFDVDEVGG